MTTPYDRAGDHEHEGQPPMPPVPPDPASYEMSPSGYPGAMPPGEPSPWDYQYPPPPVQKTNGLAIASLVLSLVGLLCGPVSIVGALMGRTALRKIQQTGERGEGLARAGMIIGWVGLVLWVCWLSYLLFSSS